MTTEQGEPLTDRLQHPELNAIVDELGEMAGTRTAGMDVTALDREALQDRRDLCDRLRFAAGHEAGAGTRARHAARGPNVDEIDAERAQSPMPADRVAPVGISAVRDQVIPLEELREGID